MVGLENWYPYKFTSLFAIVSKYILQTYLRTALLKENLWQTEKAKLLKVMESNPCEEFKTSRLYLICVMPSPELEVTIVTFAITAFLKVIS